MTTEREIREVADRAAKQAVDEVFQHLGVDMTDKDQIRRLRDTLYWANKAHEGSEQIKTSARKAVTWGFFVTVGTGAAYLLWRALSILSGVKGGGSH